MSVPPQDRPTERLRPSPPPAPVYEERVVAPAVDPNVVLLRLEDAIASVRTGLVVVGIIAVAALAIAVYGLLSDDDAGGGSASRAGLASDERVSALDDRVDRLSRQLQALRSAGANDDSEALADRVDAVERTVKALPAQGAGDNATQAIEQLSGRVDALAQDVEELKQAQANPAAP